MSKKKSVSGIFLTFVLILIVNLNIQSIPNNPKQFKNKLWGLDEHIILTIEVLESLPFKWNNEKAKMIVVFSNLYTDMWDINHTAVEQVYHFPKYSITKIDQLYPNSNADTIMLYGQPNYSTYNNDWLLDTVFNRYLDPLPSNNKLVSESPAFHFDNLFTYEMIEKRWSLFDEWLVKNGREIQYNTKIENPVKHWLGLIGLVLHAVQDFYAHSNWVLLSGYYGYSEPTLDVEKLPIWEELFDTNWVKEKEFNYEKVLYEFKKSNDKQGANEEFVYFEGLYIPNGGLQTGNVIQINKTIPNYDDYFKFPIGQNNIPWRHRHPGEREKEQYGEGQNLVINKIFNDPQAKFKEKITGLELSKRASKKWLTKMINPNIIGYKLFDSLISFVNKVDLEVYNDCDESEKVRKDFWR